MYQNIYYDRFNTEMHLWDDELGYTKFPYTPYAYVKDSGGSYTAMDGNKVKKVTAWNKESVEAGLIYEGSVKPEMRTLIDLYDDSDEVSKNHCIFCVDIEVAKEGKWSLPEDAKNTITSIAYHDSISDAHTCLLLDPLGKMPIGVVNGVTVITFSNEDKLLLHFIDQWNKLPITIVTGWNVKWFDLVYLYNRIERVLGKWKGKWLSPIQKVDNYTSRHGNKTFRIAGISILDYMELYKEMTYNQESSYSLDNISKKVLKRGKIPYDIDLDHLLATDPVKFVEYNVEDVRLVIDMDRKLDFIAIALGTCHKGHVPYDDIFFTSRYMEGACLTETKRRGIVATRAEFNTGEKAQGAFVKRSKPGRYSWVYDLDLTSLYPSNIMTLNISPETKWGKVLNWNSDDFVQGKEVVYEIELIKDSSKIMDMPSKSLRGFLIEFNYSISANGIIYDMSTVGLIPSLLDTWFGERAEYRTLSDTGHDDGDMDKYRYYDRKQKIQKVLLNSLYGVLLLPIFRFYDKDNGEAVTLTGQQLIHYTSAMANYYYNNELGTRDIDYCLYTDTDSVFYESMPIINKRYPNATEEELPDLTISVATDVQNFINKSYDMYANKFHCVDTHRWNIKQELVAKRAFWGGAKKRYAMWIVREGKKIKDEVDVKGFDSVRSSFPKLFRKFLEDVIVDILHDVDAVELNTHVIEFKEGLDNYPIVDIMNPTGVTDIEKWVPKKMGSNDQMVNDDAIRYKKGAPIHVKSAINYNIMMDDKGIITLPKIYGGDKLLYGYLIDNPYNFDTMAMIGYDDPDEIVTFMERYINRDKIFDRALQSKLQSIWDDLGWGAIIMNKHVSKFFEFN